MLLKRGAFLLLMLVNLSMIVLIYSWQLPLASSFFFDETEITNNSLQVGDWTPPESTIDLNYPLDAWLDSQPILLHIVSNDEVSPVVKVSLYYSYGPLSEYHFHLYQTKEASQGDFIAAKEVFLTYNFQPPLGDGHYDLAIVAEDAAGNQESLPVVGGAGVNLLSFDVDTTPPTTALSLGESDADRFLSADEEVDGSFENNDLNHWQFGGDDPLNQHLINDSFEAHQGDAAFQLGIDDGQPAEIDRSYLEKEYSISEPSFLSFYWRYISEDYTDFDHFDVWLESSNQKVHLLNYGLDINDPPYDTDWQETSYFLDNSWLNKIFKLRFEMVNGLDANYPSRVLIDGLRLIPANHHFISPNRELNLLAKDASGSGVATINVCLNGNCQTYQPDLINDSQSIGSLPPGVNQLSYWSTDDLGHSESTKSAVIVVKDDLGEGIVDPTDADFNLNVVINQFLADPDGSPAQGQDGDSLPLGEWVELFNRSQLESIDVSGWYLKDSADHRIDLTADRTLASTTIIDPQSSLRFYLNQAILNNNGDTLYLYDDADRLIDKVVYTQSEEGKSWARQPDGFGSWMDPEVEELATPSAEVKIATSLGEVKEATFSAGLNLARPPASPSARVELSPSPPATTSVQMKISPSLPPSPSLSPTPTLTVTPTLAPSPTQFPTPCPKISNLSDHSASPSAGGTND